MPSSDSASMSFKVCASFPDQSNWDRRCWPATSDIPAQATINKKKIEKEYFLKPEHLGGLPYDKVPVNTTTGVYVAHSYLEQAIQLRAWEVYGGPSGLNARKDQGRSFRSRWLSGSAANIYMAASTPERRDRRGSTRIGNPAVSTMSQLKSFDRKPGPGSASDEKSHISSTRTFRSRPLPVEKSLGVIEISDEETPSRSQSSVMGGTSKKRGRQSMDIIVLSSDEDDLVAKKQRTR